MLDDAVGASMLFIRLIQGFMALGLVVGVAALGVISARAVVERRQQIGMLRAIGFQPEMIRRTLLAETSIVAFTAIVRRHRPRPGPVLQRHRRHPEPARLRRHPLRRAMAEPRRRSSPP